MSDTAPNPIAAALEEARHLDAPLNIRLSLIAARVRSANPVFADAVERMIARLHLADAGSAAPAIGAPMPDFALPDDQGRIVTLSGLLAGGPLAVIFHRGHWCPYCRLNAAALSEAYDEIEAMGGQLVLIAPEKRAFTTALRDDAKARFRILSDIDNAYAMLCNLAIWVGQEMEDLMGGAGYDLPRYQGNSAWMLPVPAGFVVGRDGRVQARHIDPDYRRRWDIDRLREAMRAACGR